MNRRDTVAALLALATSAGPIGATAQSTPSGRSRTLGILARPSSRDAEGIWLGRFRTELKTRGWIEGQTLIIESAFADYKADRLPTLADGLIHKRVDVIWAFLPDAAIAAARATKSIPIVFLAVPWPVETGLIESFARPGSNVTGVSAYGIDVSTKRLEFLKEIAPKATRLSWILDAGMEATVDGRTFDVRPLLDTTAKRLGYEVRYHVVQKDEDFEPAFADILRSRAQAIAVAGSAAIFAARDRIAAFALRNRLPSACASSTLVDAGGLLSYGTGSALSVSIAHGVDYVDRILRGARPEDLPVIRPDRYELVINLKTAKDLGLAIPQSLRIRTDRIIE